MPDFEQPVGIDPVLEKEFDVKATIHLKASSKEGALDFLENVFRDLEHLFGDIGITIHEIEEIVK